MAWDAFLTVEGITGESQRSGHEGEIEVVSFNFGGTNPSSVGVGSGGGVGTVSLSPFTVTKKTDAASAELFQQMCQGVHYPEAKLTAYKSGGKEALGYLVYTFEEVYVDSIQWSGSEGGDEVPIEVVDFSFGKVIVEYTEQNPDGTAGGVHVGQWDLRTRTAE